MPGGRVGEDGVGEAYVASRSVRLCDRLLGSRVCSRVRVRLELATDYWGVRCAIERKSIYKAFFSMSEMHNVKMKLTGKTCRVLWRGTSERGPGHPCAPSCMWQGPGTP